MGQLATTIEQSQHLLDLGLSADTADMCFDKGTDLTKAHLECDNFITYFTNDEYPEVADRYVPAWSLEALLEVLPDEIRTHKGRFDAKYRFYWELRKNWILYSCLDEDYSPLIEFDGKNNLEAVFNMVVWLLENGYIKKEV